MNNSVCVESVDCRSWPYKNAANFVTGFRGLLTLWLLWTMCAHGEQKLFIFVLAIICYAFDAFDGPVARGMGIVSEFGGNFDRLVDKLLLFVMFYYMVADPRIDIGEKVIVTMLAALEGLQTRLLVKAWTRKIDATASWAGKLKMWLLAIVTLAYPALAVAEEQYGFKADLFRYIFALSVLALLLTWKSYSGHINQYARGLQRQAKA